MYLQEERARPREDKALRVRRGVKCRLSALAQPHAVREAHHVVQAHHGLLAPPQHPRVQVASRGDGHRATALADEGEDAAARQVDLGLWVIVGGGGWAVVRWRGGAWAVGCWCQGRGF